MVSLHIVIFVHCTHENKQLNLPVGGIANSILELLPFLEKIKNLKITLITKYSEYKPTSNQTKINLFHKFVISKLNTIYFFLKSFFRIVKINKKDRIHAIYIPTYYYDSISPILACTIFKIPAFIKIPSDFDTLQREIFMQNSKSIFTRMLYYGWMKFFRKFAVKKNISYQAINDKIYSDLLNLGVSKENILKLPNAISSDKYLEIKKHQFWETHYGYVGRLLKSKNIDILLNIFEQYLSRYPNDKLYIFGEGSEQTNITEFINNRNLSENIIFQGFEKDKRKIYSNIDVLIHPTFGEGCPNTILESCLTNTFIIASNVTGIRDIIKHKKSGLLFNPLKKEDLIKQLIYYKQNQDSIPTILEVAKNNIINFFDVNVISKKIYDFIKSKWTIKTRKSSMKISILTPVFPYPNRGVFPGIERYVESFAFPLKNLGADVRIVTSFWNGGKRHDNYKGIPILRILESKALFGKIGSIFHLNNLTFGLNLLRKRNYKFYKNSDVLFLPLGLGFTRLLKLKGIPVISGFLHYDKIMSLVNYFFLPFYHRMEKKQFKKHEKIITISETSKNDIIKYYRINGINIKVFPIGVDTKKFNPSVHSEKIRETYGNEILIYSGPMIPRKRVPILLSAMKKIVKKFPYLTLILLGDGMYLKSYQKLAKNLKIEKNLVWLGFVDNPELYYASSDLLVFPSELEGFGQVIIESMACGTPVICADKPPMCDIIGAGGLTFKLNNSNDLANKVIDLMDNREKINKLKMNALLRVQKYEWVRVAQDIMEYFKEEIKNKN